MASVFETNHVAHFMLDLCGICQRFCTSSALTADTMLCTVWLNSWVMVLLSGLKWMACKHTQFQSLTVVLLELFQSLIHTHSTFILTWHARFVSQKGLLQKSIREGAARNCLEKGRCSEKYLECDWGLLHHSKTSSFIHFWSAGGRRFTRLNTC